MTDDSKNLYLAIALSILVIIGWNFFYGWPQMQKSRQAVQQAQTATTRPQAPGSTVNPLAPSGAATTPTGTATTPATEQSRQDALAASPCCRPPVRRIPSTPRRASSGSQDPASRSRVRTRSGRLTGTN